jgi:predicted type IV restriction endonuclease
MTRQADLATRPLNPKLRELIPVLAARVLKDRDRHIGEENAKATLIEPVLEALGWNIRDWDEVHREYRSNSRDNPVDYALKIMRTPRLFLEAKGLGEDLTDRKWVVQTLNYASGAGVAWCVLTDGDEYRFYNSVDLVDAEEKLFRRVRLSDGNLDETVATLSLLARDNIEGNLLEPLWAAYFVDRRVKQTLLEMVESRDKRLVRLIHKELKLQLKQIAESLGRLEVRIDLPPVRPPASPPPPVAEKRIDSTAEQDQHHRRDLGVSLIDIINAGLLKVPVGLFRKYKGHEMAAMLLAGGDVEFQGKRYPSPSKAAEAARETVTGRKMSTNGWSFWQVAGDGGKPQTLEQVRDDYLKKR